MKPRPSQKQLEFLSWEFGVFFHFGIRSFFLGHRDWDNKPMPASAFNPEQLDIKSWIRTARRAGAKYAILTCKHHDGFANWPSAYSDYSVKQTPWKNGQGDVVREYVDACRFYGLKVGLYYSPAQWGGAVQFKEGKDYDDYFINQISELLTNYGKIDYLWFDACGSDGHEYDKKRIIAAIRGLQPEILIFGMWDPDTTWVGNEDGYRQFDSSDEAMVAGELRFLPPECDCMMRFNTWFDCEMNADTVKTVDELLGMYESSVGRGSNLLINIGPDRRGLLPEADAKRLVEFGDAVRKRYSLPVPFFDDVKQTAPDTWEICQPEFYAGNEYAAQPQLMNRVEICEDITNGEGVKEFELYAAIPRHYKQMQLVYKGNCIGVKHICVIPTIRSARLYVKITKHNGKCVIKSLKAYYTGE